MVPSRDDISHRIDVSKELDADYSFLNIELMCHWVEQSLRYGAIQQYSVERHNEAYNRNLQDSWNTSEHNLNYLLQVSLFWRCILDMAISELDLDALAQCWKYHATPCNVVSPSADMTASLSSWPYVKYDLL
jgi:hypothetical protein